MTDDNNKTTDEQAKPSLGNVLLSTVAAFFGVQSDKNRRRDFSSNKSFVPFFIVGVVLTTIFYLVLIGVANLLDP